MLNVLEGISGLSCYICGDGNLDEFGECSKQFQYNCSNYARRFSANEPIFCRTTRHREANGTYTILKECISESDHYKSFPRKDYPLDEECDLIEIAGKEIAYCLCRHNSYCNQKPIADQFIAFEEQHPELFGDTDDEALIQEVPSTPIEPVNQPAFADKTVQTLEASRRVTISMSDRKQQIARGAPTTELHTPSIINGVSVNQVEGLFSEQRETTSKEQKKAVDQPVSNGEIEKAKSKSPDDVLKCMQCAQGTLKNEKDDCDRQAVISCDTAPGVKDKNYCLTRQVLIGEGKNAIEKMCITNRSLTNIFGGRVLPNKCTELIEENARICVCDTPLCNQQPIYKQILNANEVRNSISPVPEPVSTVETPVHSDIASKRCYVCNENDLEREGENCLRPITVDCKRQLDHQTNTYCLTRQTELSKGVFSLEKLCITEKQFQEDFPEENALRLGCYEMFDGMIKYCVCDGDLCNQQSLAVQIANDPKYISRYNDSNTSSPSTTSKETKYHEPISIIQPGSAVRRTSSNDRRSDSNSQSSFSEIEMSTAKSFVGTGYSNNLDHSELKAFVNFVF
uniref:Thyroglobulin type-1 domain-containing protein n=1 Tax=Syphacia muris TaxID=451379 RepID=A0A0N5ATB3_9BILA